MFFLFANFITTYSRFSRLQNEFIAKFFSILRGMKGCGAAWGCYIDFSGSVRCTGSPCIKAENNRN